MGAGRLAELGEPGVERGGRSTRGGNCEKQRLGSDDRAAARTDGRSIGWMVCVGRAHDPAIVSQILLMGFVRFIAVQGGHMVPIVLWLLGVPLSLIIVLFVLGVGR